MILTVLDTETTGLDSDTHEIIEIAMISYVIGEDGQRYVVRRFDSKVKPLHIEKANPKALEINHYSEEEWANAPTFSEIAPAIKSFVEGSQLLIGQNLIFDLKFLNNSFEKLSAESIEFPPYIDTKAMADVLKDANWIKRSGMDYLCEHYQIQFEGKAHTAMTDCERTVMVWDKLLKDCGGEYDIYLYDSPYDPRFDR
jgi:DNA polymerase-3 subunit epsilon